MLYFDLSFIWSVYLSHIDIQYSESAVNCECNCSYRTPFIFRESFLKPFFFFLNLTICKIKGCEDKVAESEKIQGETPSTGLEFEAFEYISHQNQLEAPLKNVMGWQTVTTAIFPYVNSEPRGFYKFVGKFKIAQHHH